MSTHSRLSPSSADRWMLCPGSVRECEDITEVSSPSAINGTHTHTLIERCIDEGIVCPTTKVGETLMDHEGAFTVDEDRAERAKVMVDYVREKVEKYGATVQSETRTDPGKWIGRSDMEGTSDCVIIYRDEEKGITVIEIVDYKDGFKYVNPMSRQNRLYGAGKLAEHVDENGNVPFDYVDCTICQPNNRIKGVDPIGTYTTNPRELADWVRGEVAAAAAATDDPNAPLVAGKEQCFWCPAKSGCRTLFNTSLEKNGLSFPTITEDAAVRDPSGYTDEELLKLKEASPLLKLMIDAVDEELEKRVIQQKSPITGLKVIRGRGSNAWKAKTDEEVISLLNKCGIPKKSCTETKVLTPSKAKKAKWHAKKAGEEVVKSLTKNQLERLQEYIEHTPGALKVVLETDPGEAVELVETSQFAALPETQTPATPELPDWLKPQS
jgi:hypothetical protein